MGGMKPRNWQIEGGAQFFHCVSRVVSIVGLNFAFHRNEREVFSPILRKVVAFTGVRVLTRTNLSNHFHVPRTPEPGELRNLKQVTVTLNHI